MKKIYETPEMLVYELELDSQILMQMSVDNETEVDDLDFLL